MNKAHRTLWLGFCFFQGPPANFATVANLHFQFISVDTTAYDQMTALRIRVLLDPIGVPRSYINPEKEASDLLLGAFQDDRLVGCCILTRLSDTTVQLRQMAVDTAFQKQGTGALLLSFAETVAKERGYEELWLHARDSVLPFYEKCGYAVCGEQFFEVGIGHHRMNKALASNG